MFGATVKGHQTSGVLSVKTIATSSLLALKSQAHLNRTQAFWNCLFDLNVMCFPLASLLFDVGWDHLHCFLMVWKDETCFRPKCWESLRLSRALRSQGTACVFLLKFSLSYTVYITLNLEYDQGGSVLTCFWFRINCLSLQ